MLLRALMFRLAVHALHPRSTAAAFPRPGPYRSSGTPDSLEGVPDLAQWHPAAVGEDALGPKSFQLNRFQVRSRAPRRSDHPVPRQIRRVRPHDPRDDARAGKVLLLRAMSP